MKLAHGSANCDLLPDSYWVQAKDGFYGLFVCLFVFKNVIHLVRESAQAEGRVEGEGERESPADCTECGAWLGAWSHDLEILTWVKTKSWMPNWLSYPVALVFTILNAF